MAHQSKGAQIDPRIAARSALSDVLLNLSRLERLAQSSPNVVQNGKALTEARALLATVSVREDGEW